MPNKNQTDNCCEEFDKYWLVENHESGRPTYELLLEELDQNLVPIISAEHAEPLKKLAKHYREIESKRWKDDKTERYHTHGLYTAWVASQIVKQYHQEITNIFQVEASVNYRHFRDEMGKESADTTNLFMIIAAAIIHDLGGIQQEDRVGAGPKINELIPILSNKEMFNTESYWEILRIASLTNYDHERNQAYITLKGDFKFEGSKTPIESLIVIISDLLQIGAYDYQDRIVDDLKVPPESYPPSYLLLTSSAIAELGKRLNIENVSDIIPEKIRARAMAILTSLNKNATPENKDTVINLIENRKYSIFEVRDLINSLLKYKPE